MAQAKRRFCLNGHDTAVTGRHADRGCIVCKRKRSRDDQSQRRLNNPEEVRDHLRQWRIRNPEMAHAQVLRRHGISLEVYRAMSLAQGGVCAVCGKKPINGERLQVDHDHETGRIRGLLCMGCNTGLGKLEKYLDAALDYLKQVR